MPVRYLSRNQVIRRHTILAYRKKVKLESLPEEQQQSQQMSQAEKNKQYCKNYRIKQKQKRK